MPYTTNGLTIEVYYTSTLRVLINDPDGVLTLASGLQFTSAFPGGLYTDCSFYVPRELANYWDVRGADQVVIRNGQRVVWEGKIDNLNSQSSGGEQGTLVQATGYWGALMMRYAIRKRWADTRITEDVWKWQTGATNSSKFTLDRQNRIRFTPKAATFAANDYAAVRFTMPTGETCKRITFDATLSEGAQAWSITVRNLADNANEYSRTSDGTDSSQDVTIDTASQSIELRFIAGASQTATSDGTYYGEFSNITVYSETGTIDAEEVGYDIIDNCTEITQSDIGVAGLTGETLPAIDILVFDDFTSLADIAMYVAGFGNTSDESIYFQCRASEEAETNDGKPLLAAGVYPDLTSANYVVRLADDNVTSADINRSYADIKNWIAVNYTDERNEQQIITPADSGYETLTDATSTAAYGRRVDSIQAGNVQTYAYMNTLGSSFNPLTGRPLNHRPSSAGLALYYGKRYLAKWKNPLWSGSITVVGYILGSGGNEIPASEIEAGKVLDIADYLVDEVLASDTVDYPRVIITATSYDAESETCVISFGPLDDLKMIQLETMNFIPQATPSTGGTAAAGGDGAGGDRLNWKRKIGLKPGTPEWERASRASWSEKQAMINAWKKKRKKKG